MKTKTKIGLTLGLLSLLALGGLTQSKYVRNATIEMDVTSETDPGAHIANGALVGNGGSGMQEYTIPKTGYYALQLRGGDGGSNVTAKGGKGGIVEAVYYFVKDQKIYYNLGGRGGWYDVGADNQLPGTGGHAAGGRGGNGSKAAVNSGVAEREGCGGGAASGVYLNSALGDILLVAGGGGGGAGYTKDPALAGVGASKVNGDYGTSNYDNPEKTGKLDAVKIDRRRSDDTKDGENGSMWLLRYWGGGGSGGGFTASYPGGYYGIESGRPPGAGTGGHSYVNPKVNNIAFQTLTQELKIKYAAKLPTTDENGNILDFIPYDNGANTGGANNQAGQFRIAYLWSDTTADHQKIENIYK